jgi:hypothetical protein
MNIVVSQKRAIVFSLSIFSCARLIANNKQS